MAGTRVVIRDSKRIGQVVLNAGTRVRTVTALPLIIPVLPV